MSLHATRLSMFPKVMSSSLTRTCTGDGLSRLGDEKVTPQLFSGLSFCRCDGVCSSSMKHTVSRNKSPVQIASQNTTSFFAGSVLRQEVQRISVSRHGNCCTDWFHVNVMPLRCVEFIDWNSSRVARKKNTSTCLTGVETPTQKNP